MQPNERWTDDRLNDFKETVFRRLDRLEAIAESMKGVPAKIEELADDARECRQGQNALAASFAARAEERARERILALERAEEVQASRAAEKKDDRRYQLKTMFAVAGLLLTGITILLMVLQ